ncbi:MAG TPA: DNA (cytosine-5-)-methyltransferase [Egibacteraceae bacterium]|nr:DNA (cytosine-5-)-methyltransferase [Egibacteraceae bacterium]
MPSQAADQRMDAQLRVAEFFGGIGLVRLALEPHGFEVVWANDIEPAKAALYVGNFDSADLHLGDIRDVDGGAVPSVDLATASFPCTDLSLAGARGGLRGAESSMFWQFARVLDEMGERQPDALLLENVLGFASSREGRDLAAAVAELNRLGYWCDLFTVDARWFVPQSRPRMFIVGARKPLDSSGGWEPSPLRPAWVKRFVEDHPQLQLQAFPLPDIEPAPVSLAAMVERFPPQDDRWWDPERAGRFVESLSAIQRARLDELQRGPRLQWRTAYRRTRDRVAVWEIRADDIAGCLRTARGGSSRQALVEAGRGQRRVRWMTPREYARLMGASEYRLGAVRNNQAYFGFGDAVCVPVIGWIAQHYLRPLLRGDRAGQLTGA